MEAEKLNRLQKRTNASPHFFSGLESSQSVTVYIIDDDREMQTILSQLFSSLGYSTRIFSTARAALEWFDQDGAQDSAAKNSPGLIVCDLKLPDQSGIELIDQMNQRNIALPVILVTAHATIETAVEALNRGFFDYVTKPINLNELSIISKRAIRSFQLESAYQALYKSYTHVKTVGEMTSRSPKMQRIFELIESVSKSNSNVFISGESGTGKEVVARSIHAKSPRADQPFVAVNCSAIPENLLESELFGHKKGSFTGANETRRGLFEEAEGGTIFLDEIGDMPFLLQAKLLRVIQERKIKPIGENKLKSINVRVISATHINIRQAIDESKFREDLYYRLCVIPIDLPPLRERKEDIPILAEAFLSKYGGLSGTPNKRFTKSAISKLLRLNWNGNVRELENTIERAVVLSQAEIIDKDDIKEDRPSRLENHISALFSKLPSLRDVEIQYIKYVLEETHFKKEKATHILGINRKTLYRKEREYNLMTPEGEQQTEFPL